MTRVKICGVMNPQDIAVCIQAGADMIGFVVDYPVVVPWNLSVSAAKELIRQVPPFVSSCMVTGGSVSKVLELAYETRPHTVQLHYRETLREVQEISSLLQEQGIKTLKALRISAEGICDFEISDPAAAARELSQTGVAALVVDAHTSTMPGGTGVRVDAAIFQAVKQASLVPVVLAGGLTPENVRSVIEQTNPYAIDVLTGVEARTGYKDREKVRRLIKSVKQAAYAEMEPSGV